MNRSFARRLAVVDAEALAPLVHAALGDDSAEVISHDFEPVSGGYAGATVGGRGVFRFFGEAMVAGGGNKRWSMILKVLGRRRGVGSEDPVAWDYWQREILAYRSGVLEALPGLAAPRCYGIIEYPGDEYWIWLEDIGDVAKSRDWSVSDYAAAGRSFGLFNGAYLEAGSLPDRSWFSLGRTRSWLEMARPTLETLDTYLRNAKRPHWLSARQAARVLDLYAKRERLLEKLDLLPRTLCHHDAFRRNLFPPRKGDDRTIAIDWQVIGTGAIGEELVPLIGISLQFLDCDPRLAAKLEAEVLASYLAGLREAGWRGDARLARFGYAASAALFIGVATVGCWPSIVHEERYRATERMIGRPIDEILAAWTLLQDHFLDLGDEALRLADEIWPAHAESTQLPA